MLQGPAQFVVVLAGWEQLVDCIYFCVGGRELPGCGAPLCLRSPLELLFPPLGLVLPPLEGALLVVPLGLREPCYNWPWPLLPRFMPVLFW